MGMRAFAFSKRVPSAASASRAGVRAFARAIGADEIRAGRVQGDEDEVGGFGAAAAGGRR